MNERIEAALRTDGWHPAAQKVVSPNQDARPVGTRIELIVLHAISLPPGHFGGDAIIDFFCNRLDHTAHPFFSSLAGRRVSAHFLVRRDGGIIQFVSCRERAWHAGVSCWRGRERCNDFSIGIELEGDDTRAFSENQYVSLTDLLGSLVAVFPIKEIVGHHDVAAGRKTDPGPYFDWRRIRWELPGLMA